MKQRRVTNGDFFGLLERMQSQRMDDQRCPMPSKNGYKVGIFIKGDIWSQKFSNLLEMAFSPKVLIKMTFVLKNGILSQASLIVAFYPKFDS